MKFFDWVQNKFNGGEEKNRNIRINMPNPIPVTNVSTSLISCYGLTSFNQIIMVSEKKLTNPMREEAHFSAMSDNVKKEPPKEEFNDWPHGLLTIGTFGNKDLKSNQGIQVERISETEIPQEEEQCSSPDFSEFTAEEVVKLQKELKRLLTRKTVASKPSTEEEPIVDLPLERLNCPSSLEVDRTISNRYSITSNDHKDEEDIDRTIKIILGRCKDVCEKKSVSFLLKKMFVCPSGFVPTPHLCDSLQESRMEKLLKTMLTKKIYPQNGSRASSIKKYIEDNTPNPKAEKEDESRDKSNEGSSRWDKTDTDFIVLEI